ncbi:HET-domain-containing protein [Aspergillus niger ATCC 13496]|uniref:HET-domain-containing protein n=1 Tax=Aspergillus niger ATCC 13496 TaxID=1353008 RepID=A0A370C939_ASPNG|nr:HET-domain-containing protein [Aspergillus niger ATCC 13496]
MTSGSAYAGWIHGAFMVISLLQKSTLDAVINRWSFETGTASEITELIAGCNNESVLGRCTLLRHLKTTFRYDRSEKDSENISHYLVHRAIDDAYISIDRRQSSTLHIPSYSDLQKEYKESGYTHPLRIINRFDLLRQWLKVCDKKHACLDGERQVWPKRVIFVGTEHSNQLQLKLSADIEHPFDYISLSHCWGTPTNEEKERFCTTPKNYNERLRGFGYYSLPKVFQDAITVTRELNKQYLWIDALCIIQGDDNDWKKEGVRMEEVYSSAYCTIASSSASSWCEGFLHRSQQCSLSEGASSNEKNINDFRELVDKGQLHTRAWALQERALSRRTIYFTAQQTYWECYYGVCCENFGIITCPVTRGYLLDPQFPKLLLNSGYTSTALFVQELITDYSCRDLTYPEKDKVIAFSSIAKRIAEALSTEVSFGVFHCMLPRLLLWKQAGKHLVPIYYKDKSVPSWSWMFYNGKVDFLTRSTLLVPQFQSLNFDDSMRSINIEVREFEYHHMSRRDREYIIYADTGEIGSLYFDMDSAAEIEPRNCVVIAMSQYDNEDDSNKEYYILAVQKTSGEEEYERLGVGRVRAGYVSKGSTSGKLL